MLGSFVDVQSALCLCRSLQSTAASSASQSPTRCPQFAFSINSSNLRKETAASTSPPSPQDLHKSVKTLHEGLHAPKISNIQIHGMCPFLLLVSCLKTHYQSIDLTYEGSARSPTRKSMSAFDISLFVCFYLLR
jgi:hypothetical protein